MQQHLQRLDGVAKAEVSLRDGHVTITPKPDASLDPYLILKATYDSGVTVAEMAITVSGEIVQTGGALALHVNARQSFEISPGAIAEQLKSAATRGDASAAPRVTVKGILYRKPPGKGKPKMPTTGLKLEITESNDVR